MMRPSYVIGTRVRIYGTKNYDGFVVYSYSDISRKSCSEEMKRLREYIKNNGN